MRLRRARAASGATPRGRPPRCVQHVQFPSRREASTNARCKAMEGKASSSPEPTGRAPSVGPVFFPWMRSSAYCPGCSLLVNRSNWFTSPVVCRSSRRPGCSQRSWECRSAQKRHAASPSRSAAGWKRPSWPKPSLLRHRSQEQSRCHNALSSAVMEPWCL